MAQSLFNGYYADIESMLRGGNIQAQGSGTGDHQYGSIQGRVPIYDGISAFFDQGLSNNKWTGLDFNRPKLGVGYQGDGFSLDLDRQSGVPVDKRVYGFDAPNTETRYGANLNIPFSLG